jgi:diguanylate cyclase (GGDEF)-like protein
MASSLPMQAPTPDAHPDTTALEDAVDAAALIGATRSRARGAIPPSDRRSGLLTGGSFTLVLGAWLLLQPPAGASLGAFAACVIAHAVAASVEFEIGPGSALPTTPVLVVALFLLPPPLVPAMAASGLLLAAGAARLRDPSRRERVPVLVGSAWHAIGPAAVFAAARVSQPDLGDVPVFLLALAAQLGCDAVASWVRNSYGLGIPPRRLAAALRFTFTADLLLAPMGLAAALAIPGSPTALLLLLPPTLLLAMLQRDRQEHISRAIVLGEAMTEAADQARHDALTGLQNRLAWEEALAAHRSSPLPFGVVFIDVDDLKTANDLLGHEAGDRLLGTVATALRRVAPDRGGVLVARLGGDEFGVLLPGGDEEEAVRVSRALRVELAATPPIGDGVAVSASIGVGVSSAGALLGTALADADRQLYEDKSRKRSRKRAPGSTA